MKTPGAVLLLLWSALVVVAAESGDGISENDIFSQGLYEAEMREDEVLGAATASIQQTVLREMSALVAELRNTKAQMETMEARLRANEKTVMTMETRLRANEKTVMTMETRLRANERTVMTTEARLRANEKIVMTTETRLRANEKLVQQLMKDIEVSAVNLNLTGSLVEKLKRKREERRVAFSVSLIKTGYVSVGPANANITLRYKNVITNIGNAYNPKTGFFTAPVRGVYYFALFVYGYGHKSVPVGASLRKNREHVVIAQSHLPHGKSSASNAASLLLEVGDKVRVVLYDSWVHDSYKHFTSFSGHLLFPM